MAEIHDLLKELKESDDEYLQEQADKVEKYIADMEAGIIPEQLCRSYVQDVRDLIQLDMLRDRIRNKALAQKALEEITKLLMKGVASAIKGMV